MWKQFIFVLLFILFGLTIFNSACKKMPDLPLVHTSGVTDIGLNSANFYGYLTGLEISEKGFCWDTINTPTIDNFKTNEGKGSERFNSVITHLLPNKRYSVRAYAINPNGVAYGEVIKFKTVNPPSVTTNDVSANSYSHVTVAGYVNTNAYSILESGIVYDTKFTIDTSKKVLGNATGFISVELDSLIEKTVYYYQAYAIFSFGTFYGEVKTFTTGSSPLPIVTFTNFGSVTDINGLVYTTVKIGNQTWMTENLRVTKYRDGSNITYGSNGTTYWANTTTGAYGYLFNSGANAVAYGHLYNYYSIEDVKGITPIGWHIPSRAEWQTLITTLQNTNISYSLTAMQQLFDVSSWSGLSCIVNNYSNMKIKSTGYRNYLATDSELGIMTGFWTTENSGTYGTAIVFSSNCDFQFSSKLKSTGYSIRCVKD